MIDNELEMRICILEKHSPNYVAFIDFDQSDKCMYVRYIVNSDMYIAENKKGSKLIKMYKLYGSVINNDKNED